MTSAPRGARDRPPGLAPRGSIWGLAAIILIELLVGPAAVLLSCEWLPLSLDGLLGSMFGSIFVAFPVLMVLAIGQSSRRYWGVCCLFYVGVICIALTAIAALVGMAAPLGWVRPVHLDYIGMVYMGWGALAVCVVMCWPLIRALRLHYWQPWARPETWEAGDERNARWANRMVGLPSPPRPPRRR